MIAFLYDREKVIPLIRLRVAISSGVLKVIVTLFCVTQVLAAITQYFSVILENFRLCLIQRTLEELPDFEVMTWQLCRMLRSALNCFQVTRFCVQK